MQLEWRSFPLKLGYFFAKLHIVNIRIIWTKQSILMRELRRKNLKPRLSSKTLSVVNIGDGSILSKIRTVPDIVLVVFFVMSFGACAEAPKLKSLSEDA